MKSTTEAENRAGRLLTVPNVLCILRLVGSLGLVLLAIAGQPVWMLALFLGLTVTDWLDGKIAVWFHQRSAIGPGLDTAADVTMYASLLVAFLFLKGETLLAELTWIGAAVLTYGLSCLASLVKFRRLPSYHTRSAKTAWLFMIAATVALLLDWSPWPLRVAMVAVALANIEAVIITGLLDRRQTDVHSCITILRERESSADSERL